jgi:hypothetical protein
MGTADPPMVAQAGQRGVDPQALSINQIWIQLIEDA